MKIPLLLLGIVLSTFVPQVHSANVTSWGNNNPQSYTSQLVGRWALAGIFANGQNITGEAPSNDYWIFKRNGFVELKEGGKPLRRSYFRVSNRNLTIKNKKTREQRHFTIKYIDQRRLILILSREEQDHTYNFERY